MKVPIASITIPGDRARVDLGAAPANRDAYPEQWSESLDALAQSMDRLGQLMPILIDQDGVLLAGERRVRAAQRLGWDSVEAVPYSGLLTAHRRLSIELAENERRKSFTTEERLRLAADIEVAERELARQRMLSGRAADPTRSGVEGSIPDAGSRGKGEAADRAAQAVGLSGDTLRRGKSVLSAIETLESRGDQIAADSVRDRLNRQGVKAGLRAAQSYLDPTPAPTPDQVFQRDLAELRAKIEVLLISIEASGHEPDLVDDDTWRALSRLHAWASKRRPKLRAV